MARPLFVITGTAGDPGKAWRACRPGDPLVVLHGAYMNIPTMGAIIPKLARTHRVYAVELQGHGRTTDMDRPITYPNLADDVAAFMDAVDLKKTDVFGYSMGAAVALKGTTPKGMFE